MNRITMVVLAAVIGLGVLVQDVEAKRFGGGTSSGMRRDSSIMQRQALPPKPTSPSQATAPSQANSPAPAAPRSGMSRWLGPLAGLAAGIGLAAMFSHLGMGADMGNVVVLIALALAAVFLVRWMRSKGSSNTSMQYANSRDPTLVNIQPASIGASVPATAPALVMAPNTAATVPGATEFDVEGFLRQAKLHFIRLQAANDRGDMEDIRQFTSPEMFAEVQLEYQERGRKTQQTDVIELHASLLDVTNESTRQLVSVRFSGQIREEVSAAPEAFSEVWHLSNAKDSEQKWTVIGIQQD